MYNRAVSASGYLPFTPSVQNISGKTCAVEGIDLTDSRLIGVDTQNGWLRQSTDWSATWSTNKTYPTNVAWYDFGPVVRFGAYLYALGLDSVSNRVGIYRALPQSGNTVFSWSAPLMLMAVGTQRYSFALTADSSYVYASEYGNPTGGPSVYRSSDGSSWTTILTIAAALHIHAIAVDPYNAGHIWLACGDGVAGPIRYSTNSGSTFTNVPSRTGYVPQVVQLSFSADWVFAAGDATACTAFVIDRATKKWRALAPNLHSNVAIPGNTVGNVFDSSSLYGAVDPATGIYYTCPPTSGGWPVSGLFTCLYPGARFELTTFGESGGAIRMANGILFFGGHHRNLLSLDDFV